MNENKLYSVRVFLPEGVTLNGFYTSKEKQEAMFARTMKMMNLKAGVLDLEPDFGQGLIVHADQIKAACMDDPSSLQAVNDAHRHSLGLSPQDDAPMGELRGHTVN